MAKQTTDMTKTTPATTAVATTNGGEITDLTQLGDIQGTTVRPASLETSGAGKEDIGANDIRLPRLAIAQGLSPQMIPGNAQHLEELKMYDMFNDLTNEIYGKGPITFVPIRRDIRHIEFRPRAEGGGVLDMDVPRGDPRLAWTPATETTPRKPPRATTFVEFVILLLRAGRAPEPIVMSIKQTNKHNRRASDQLTSFIGLRDTAIYSGLYVVDTKVPASNDQGTWGVPKIQNAGFIPKDTPQGAALYKYAEDFHMKLKDMTIIVERETPDDEDTSFDTAAMDGEVVAEPKPGDAKADM